VVVALGHRFSLLLAMKMICVVYVELIRGVPLVNTFIGIFDLLKSDLTAIGDPNWENYGTELYMLLASIYFCCCFAMSRYSSGLERALDRGRQR
jgi:general L-amino acid transport system permease protein